MNGFGFGNGGGFDGPGFDWNGNDRYDVFDDFMNMKCAEDCDDKIYGDEDGEDNGADDEW